MGVLIETDMESAEAKALFVRVLDPNGKMRRGISCFANKAFGGYLVVSGVLLLAHSFGLTNPVQSAEAIEGIKVLCLPVTSAWGVIVGASFGVNGMNIAKGS